METTHRHNCNGTEVTTSTTTDVEADGTVLVWGICSDCGFDALVDEVRPTRRLVNATVAYNVNGDLVLGFGSWGNPLDALKAIAHLAGDAGIFGIAITDVRTGEGWLVPRSVAREIIR